MDLTKVSGVYHLTESDFNMFLRTNGINTWEIPLQQTVMLKGAKFYFDGASGTDKFILWINAGSWPGMEGK